MLSVGRAAGDRDFVVHAVGPRTSSHGGRYVVRRKGLLDEIPHVRLIRGVILVRTEDAERVLELLQTFRTEVHTRSVQLDSGDRATLAAPS